MSDAGIIVSGVEKYPCLLGFLIPTRYLGALLLQAIGQKNKTFSCPRLTVYLFSFIMKAHECAVDTVVGCLNIVVQWHCSMYSLKKMEN